MVVAQAQENNQYHQQGAKWHDEPKRDFFL
jgi:hypothetical protein